jgi:hypothetical protein
VNKAIGFVVAERLAPIQQARYHICPLYDQNVAKKSGSAYPIKLQLSDANGNNLSSSSIVVHAVNVTRVNINSSAALDDTGNANPDFDFRYDLSLGGYIFNFSSKGYAGTSAGLLPRAPSAFCNSVNLNPEIKRFWRYDDRPQKKITATSLPIERRWRAAALR